jgi:hypothetical protein
MQPSAGSKRDFGSYFHQLSPNEQKEAELTAMLGFDNPELVVRKLFEFC